MVSASESFWIPGENLFKVARELLFDETSSAGTEDADGDDEYFDLGDQLAGFFDLFGLGESEEEIEATETPAPTQPARKPNRPRGR